MFGFGASQSTRLISNVLLAGMLNREAFGLMALIGAFMQGFVMFSDVGIGPNIVQSKRGDEPEFLDTAWTIQIIRAIFVSAVALLLAYPLAHGYAQKDPANWQLLGLLPMVALGNLIEGFRATKFRTAARHINLARITLIQYGSNLFGILAMLIAVYYTRSVYALPLASIGRALCETVASFLLIPGRGNRLRLEPESLRQIASFSRWIFFSSIIGFFAAQVDKLVFGGVFPVAVLGEYNIAVQLAALAPTVVSRLQFMVVFPMLSRLNQQGRSLKESIGVVFQPIMTSASLLIALVLAGGETFIESFYDDRYQAAGQYLVVLAIGSWFAALQSFCDSAMLSVQKGKWLVVGGLTKVLSFSLLLIPALRFGGIELAVWAVTLSSVCMAMVGVASLKQNGAQLLKPMLVYFGLTLMAGFGARWIGHLPGLISPAVKLAIEGLVVVALFAPALQRAYRSYRSAEG